MELKPDLEKTLVMSRESMDSFLFRLESQGKTRLTMTLRQFYRTTCEKIQAEIAAQVKSAYENLLSDEEL